MTAGSSTRRHGLAAAIASPSRWVRYLSRYLDFNPRTRQDSDDPVKTVLTYAWNRFRYRAVAPPYAVIRVDPRVIRWKLRASERQWPIGLIHNGNWDRALRQPVDTRGKLVSMWQRFRLGYPWEETDIFRLSYRPRLAAGGKVRGMTSEPELVAFYYEVIDALHASMQARGFATPTPTDPAPTFVYVHIGRDGEILYTFGGNHRLGIALALELDTIPVRVASRHTDWQLVRERVARERGASPPRPDHPDLHDLHAAAASPR